MVARMVASAPCGRFAKGSIPFPGTMNFDEINAHNDRAYKKWKESQNIPCWTIVVGDTILPANDLAEKIAKTFPV